jgi:hypothetical protein
MGGGPDALLKVTSPHLQDVIFNMPRHVSSVVRVADDSAGASVLDFGLGIAPGAYLFRAKCRFVHAVIAGSLDHGYDGAFVLGAS